MSYEPVFTPQYQNGWQDRPDTSTPVIADALNDYDNAILNVEGYLERGMQYDYVGKNDTENQLYGEFNVIDYVSMTSSPSVPAKLTIGTRDTSQQKGSHSVCLGNNNTASGANSFAQGVGCVASGDKSSASGNYATASGEASSSEGSYTTASSDNSHAEGYHTTASSMYSHAEGSYTTASGYQSHAEGSGTTASAPSSHASGTETVAGYESQFVCGEFNDNKSTNLFEVGNGSYGNTSNAFEVDSSGNITAGGDVTDGNGTTIASLLSAINDLTTRVAALEGN